VTLAPPSRSGAHPGEGLSPPPVHRWDGDGAGPSVPSAGAGLRTGGGFRLWSSRRLYDPGVVVTHSAAVSGLAVSPAVRLHPDEVGRLGVGAGASVRVTSPRGSVTLPALADSGVPVGVASIPPGAAADLVDAAAVTAVTVEAEHG
jgi:formylmethanofuran dehydrogenase subunit D